MDSLKNDIESYYKPIINRIKNFRGADAFVLDTVRKVASREVSVREIKVRNLYGVVDLLTKISENRL